MAVAALAAAMESVAAPELQWTEAARAQVDTGGRHWWMQL